MWDDLIDVYPSPPSCFTLASITLLKTVNAQTHLTIAEDKNNTIFNAEDTTLYMTNTVLFKPRCPVQCQG